MNRLPIPRSIISSPRYRMIMGPEQHRYVSSRLRTRPIYSSQHLESSVRSRRSPVYKLSPRQRTTARRSSPMRRSPSPRRTSVRRSSPRRSRSPPRLSRLSSSPFLGVGRMSSPTRSPRRTARYPPPSPGGRGLKRRTRYIGAA